MTKRNKHRDITCPAAGGCLDRRKSANYLSISTRKLDELASCGEIPRMKLGSKTVFRVSDLDAFVDSKIQRLDRRQEREV